MDSSPLGKPTNGRWVTWKGLAVAAIGLVGTVAVGSGAYVATASLSHIKEPMHKGAEIRIDGLEKQVTETKDEIRADLGDIKRSVNEVRRDQAVIKATLPRIEKDVEEVKRSVKGQ